jgi:hypothetical protein
MKLTKDQTQKIALGGLMLVALIYGYFEFLLGPVQKGREAALKAIETIGPQIATARGKVLEIEALKAKAPASKHTITQIKGLVPEGSPVAWFPPRITEFFKRQGVEKVTTRLTNESPEKDLPGFRRMAWGIEVPRVEFGTFGTAVSELENQEMLLEIGTIELEASRDDFTNQRVTLTLSNLANL